MEEKLGGKFAESRSVDLSKSFEESGPSTAIFFILSPGVDPLKDVEKLGRKIGFSAEQGNFHNISLGQGQEAVAERAMEVAAREGHWIVLQVLVYLCMSACLLACMPVCYSRDNHLVGSIRYNNSDSQEWQAE